MKKAWISLVLVAAIICTCTFQVVAVDTEVYLPPLAADNSLVAELSKDNIPEELKSGELVLPMSTENYREWAQADSRWGSLMLGSSGTSVAEAGCLVTSITKLIIQHGYRSSDSFDVGTLVNWLNSNSGFTSEGNLYWNKPAALIDGMSNYGDTSASGYSSALTATILGYVNNNYGVLLNVNNGGHWIAVDGAKTKSTGQVYIMDTLSSAANADILLTSRYGYVNRIHLYSFTNPPQELVELPGAPELQIPQNGNMFLEDSEVGFYWSIPDNADHFDLELTLDGVPHTIYRVAVETILEKLQVGEWSAIVRAVNENGSTDSNVVDFKVVPESEIAELGTIWYNGNKYVLYNAKGDVHTAEAYCQERGGHLVSIHSAEEQEVVFNLMKTYGNGMSSVLLGLTDQESEGTFVWTSGEPVTYTVWGSGQPDDSNSHLGEDLVELRADGTWNDTSYPCYFVGEYPSDGYSVQLSEETQYIFESVSSGKRLNVPARLLWKWSDNQYHDNYTNGYAIGYTADGSVDQLFTLDEESAGVFVIYPAALSGQSVLDVYRGTSSDAVYSGDRMSTNARSTDADVGQLFRIVPVNETEFILVSNSNPAVCASFESAAAAAENFSRLYMLTYTAAPYQMWRIYTADGTQVEAVEGCLHDYQDGYCTKCGEEDPTPIASGRCGNNIMFVGSNLQWVLSRDGVLTIFGSGQMKNYDASSKAPWYDYRNLIEKVVMEEGVTSIGNYAFLDCTRLTRVAFTDTITAIGNYAFGNCSGLTSVTLPNGVTSIKKGVFYGCSSLSGVVIPESVTSIDWSAFEACSSLTGVVIPENVTSIGSFAFRYCDNLISVTIPDGVNEIQTGAFYGCTSLGSIQLPRSITKVDCQVFYGCSSIVEVTIPNSVTSIVSQAFSGCSSLKEMKIPDSVTSIGWGAFEGCSSLVNVTIPNSVTTIGDRAFYGCSSLSSVMIPESVTTMDGGVFRNCRSLTEICVDPANTVYSSVDGVLYRHNLATLLQYPGGKTQTEYVIPNGVTFIDNWAFSGCSRLTDVKFAGQAPRIGTGAFTYVTAKCWYPANDSTWTSDVMQDYGGTLTWVPYTPLSDFYGASMTLGNDLRMNFYISMKDLPETGLVASITRNGTVTTIPMTQWETSGSYYKITYAGIAAKEMAESISVVLLNADGEPVSTEWVDGVRSYAMRIIDRESTPLKQKILLVDMLNYGAAAQENFGYNTDDLANALLTEEHKALATSSISLSDYRVKGTNYYGSALILSSNIQLKLYFSNVTSDMTATVTYTNHMGEQKTVEKEILMSGSYGYVLVEELVVADGRQLVTCTVKDKNGAVVAYVTDSLESYCFRTMASQPLNDYLMRFVESAYKLFH